MDDLEKKRQLRDDALDEHDASKVDHTHAQLHEISPEDDARIRRKVDLVVLPMVWVHERILTESAKAYRAADVSGLLHPVLG